MIRTNCKFYNAKGPRCEILIKMTCRERSKCSFYKRKEGCQKKGVEDLFRKEDHAAYMRIVLDGNNNGKPKPGVG